jgi:uncharacterized protein YuzE
MRVRVNHASDAVYLNLTDRPIKDSEEVADGIVVDYDHEGRIVGVEILECAEASAARMSEVKSGNKRRHVGAGCNFTYAGSLLADVDLLEGWMSLQCPPTAKDQHYEG